MQDIPPDLPLPQSITDVDVDDDSSDKTNSADDSNPKLLLSDEPKLKKMKMANLKKEEDGEEDNEEEDDDDDDEEEEDEEMEDTEKKASEMSDDELLDFFILHPDMYFDVEKAKAKLPKLRRYLQEVEESDGFDIDHFPEFHVQGLTTIIPHYLSNFVESDAYYKDLAEWGIEDYNDKNGTGYDDVQVEKVNITISNYITYYLTFTATDMDMNAAGSDKIDARKTFQALMSADKIHPDKDPRVFFCRLKRN